MREMDLRITELCEYLHFSRPTMYRFIDNYEAGRYRGVDRGVLALFRYIDGTPNIGKKNVISYIINNINTDANDDSESPLMKAAMNYESGKATSDYKTDFLIKIMSSSKLDDMIRYCSECETILSKETLTDEDLMNVGRYVLFRYEIDNDKGLTKTQLEKTKKIVEGQYGRQ